MTGTGGFGGDPTVSVVFPDTNLVFASPRAAKLPFLKFIVLPGTMVALEPINLIIIFLLVRRTHLASLANLASVAWSKKSEQPKSGFSVIYSAGLSNDNNSLLGLF